MKNKSVIYSIIVVITFLLAFYARKVLSNFFVFTISDIVLKIAYIYIWWLFPTALVCGILFGFNKLFSSLGLKKGFFKGFLFALVTVSPMLLSSAFIGKISSDFKILNLVQQTLLAGFMEEYLFRGFLFGLLFLKLRWGFIPASILGAIIFGLGHIYQGNTFAETSGVFFITAIGAVWFSWLYVEWDNNLWIVVFLHILMNLSWILFDVSSNALGGIYVNLFRVITIALTIIITIKRNRINGLKINKTNLLANSNI
jgi:hypothetical protein